MNNSSASRFNKTLQRGALAVASFALLAGCASTQAPIEQMAVTKAAVNNARSAGGNELAPLQFKSAMEKLQAAERAMADKNYELAKRLAEQAEVDAKLASSMANSVKAQKAADALQEDVRVLRQEINRTK